MDKLSPPLSSVEPYDSRPIEVELVGHKMIIPRNFITSAWFSDDRLALQFYAMYPDFEGATRENIHAMERLVGAKTPDVVTITRFDGYDAGEAFRHSLSQAARGYGIKTDIDGLVKVTEGFKNAEGILRDGSSIYIHKSEDSDKDIIIMCTGEVMNLHNCMVDIKIYEGVYFKYSYFFSHLRDWKDIHAKVTNLLHSFFRN